MKNVKSHRKLQNLVQIRQIILQNRKNQILLSTSCGTECVANDRPNPLLPNTLLKTKNKKLSMWKKESKTCRRLLFCKFWCKLLLDSYKNIEDQIKGLKSNLDNLCCGCTAIVLTEVNNTANANAANIFMLSSYVLELKLIQPCKSIPIFKFKIAPNKTTKNHESEMYQIMLQTNE